MSISKVGGQPPLDPKLAPGNTFDKDLAEKLLGIRVSKNEWYKLPAWYAGRWHQCPSISTFQRDERTGIEDSTSRQETGPQEPTWGNFADKTGQVWRLEYAGRWYKEERGNVFVYMYTLTDDLTSATDKDCFFSATSIVFTVNRESGQILTVNQQACTSTVHSIDPGTIKTTKEAKAFDWEGNLIATQCFSNESKKFGEFVPDPDQRTVDGGPLYPVFTRFLRANGMADRIPDVPSPVEKSGVFP